MQDDAARVLDLQRRVDKARAAHAKAQAVYEQSQTSFDQAVSQLKTEFGIDSIAEAATRLKDLQAQFNEGYTKIDKALGELEADC